MAWGSTKQQSSHLKFIEIVWGYIWRIELLAPDNVYLHKNSTTKLEGTTLR